MTLLPAPARPFAPAPAPGDPARRATRRPAAARPAPAADPARSRRRHASPLAPWPVWAGLALLLSGAAGSGTLALRRRAGRAAPACRRHAVPP